MFMWVFFAFFSYRCKVIVKGVSNIIGIGYSITMIKGDTVGTPEATVFREIKNLIPFPCVLDIRLESKFLYIVFAVSVKFLF